MSTVPGSTKERRSRRCAQQGPSDRGDRGPHGQNVVDVTEPGDTLTAIRPFSPFRGSFPDHARGELEPRGLELPPAVERHMEEAQISYNWTRTRSAFCAPGP